MRTSTPRLTVAASERLLDGGDGPADLRHLLTAAAGPGTARELAGERAAVAAFSAPPPVDVPGRRSMIQTLLSKTLAVKAIAVVVLSAGATGGIALATTSTLAPSETSGAVAGRSVDAPVPPDDVAGPAVTDPEEPADTAAERAGGPSGAEPSGLPEQSLSGLCRAWAAQATDNPGRAGDNPVFARLVEVAGGTEDVEAFCAADADTATGGRPETAPGNPDRPTGPGTGGEHRTDPSASSGDDGGPAHSDTAARTPERADR